MEPDKKPLILIVDDTPANIQVLGNILYSNGYNISISYSGAHALQSVNTLAPDLILLDIQMPGMDGYEVCKALKSNSSTKNIPVIFLTAAIGSENILQGFELGAVDYITKPFNVAELIARVSTHIELKSSREKIEAEKEKTERLNVALTDTNSKLDEAYNDIKDSIYYAKRIQDDMLPDLNFLQKAGIEHIVIYKPKDTIGGDFYWATHIEARPGVSLSIIAVADCTGHGVPGALLSMTGHNLLNEIICIENIYDPAEILNILNMRLRKILNQKNNFNRDGMDIALCVINSDTNKLEYAGANRPVYLISNSLLSELAPDKFFIGGHENSDVIFKKQTIELNSGDRFFMFTDGIADQFGYLNNKKLTRKGFERHLSLYSDKPFDTIEADLSEFLKHWQGGNTQTDDILLLGFEIS